MPRLFIVRGDRTDHGGTVITGDDTTDIYGKAVARIGDMVVCPKCKGVFPIVTGSPDTASDGRAWARNGDKTACGATLIATQAYTSESNESSLGDRAAAEDAARVEAAAASSEVATPMSSGICLDCLRQAAHQGATMIVRR